MCWLLVLIGYTAGMVVGIILHYLLVLFKENDDANQEREPF